MLAKSSLVGLKTDPCRRRYLCMSITDGLDEPRCMEHRSLQKGEFQTLWQIFKGAHGMRQYLKGTDSLANISARSLQQKLAK